MLRVEDLITWITVDAEWTWGRLGKCDVEVQPPKNQDDEGNTQFRDCTLDLSDVEKEKRSLGGEVTSILFFWGSIGVPLLGLYFEFLLNGFGVLVYDAAHLEVALPADGAVTKTITCFPIRLCFLVQNEHVFQL